MMSLPWSQLIMDWLSKTTSKIKPLLLLVVDFCHCVSVIRKLTNTGNCYLRNGVFVVTITDDEFRSLGNWFVGGIWKVLELWVREALGYCKLSLVRVLIRTRKIWMSIRMWRKAWEVSHGNKDSIGTWSRRCVYYIMAENLSTVCPCPETLWENEIKAGGVINLAEEILIV